MGSFRQYQAQTDDKQQRLVRLSKEYDDLSKGRVPYNKARMRQVVTALRQLGRDDVGVPAQAPKRMQYRTEEVPRNFVRRAWDSLTAQPTPTRQVEVDPNDGPAWRKAPDVSRGVPLTDQLKLWWHDVTTPDTVYEQIAKANQDYLDVQPNMRLDQGVLEPGRAIHNALERGKNQMFQSMENGPVGWLTDRINASIFDTTPEQERAEANALYNREIQRHPESNSELFASLVETPIQSITAQVPNLAVDALVGMATAGASVPVTLAMKARYGIPVARAVAATMRYAPAVTRGIAAGIGSANQEYVGTVYDELAQHGVDITDPNALLKAYHDPDLMKQAHDVAVRKAAVVGTFDGMMGGLAGFKAVGAAREAKALFSEAPAKAIWKLARAGTLETGIQAAGGATGEALSQVAAKGHVYDWRGVWREATGEILPGGVEVATGAMTRLQNPYSHLEGYKGPKLFDRVEFDHPDGSTRQGQVTGFDVDPTGKNQLLVVQHNVHGQLHEERLPITQVRKPVGTVEIQQGDRGNIDHDAFVEQQRQQQILEQAQQQAAALQQAPLLSDTTTPDTAPIDPTQTPAIAPMPVQPQDVAPVPEVTPVPHDVLPADTTGQRQMVPAPAPRHSLPVPDAGITPEYLHDVMQARMPDQPSPGHDQAGAGWQGWFPANQIVARPDEMQYKTGMGKGGAGSLLRGDEDFNHTLGRTMDVWRDPTNGEVVVVNGHHRLDKAQRAGVPLVNVEFMAAPNARVAKIVGALLNIGEGRGTAIDAANFFREVSITPKEAKTLGITLRENLARKGLALSQLHPAIYHQIVREEGPITEDVGVIIGQELPDQDQQMELVRELDRQRKRHDLSPGFVKALIERVKHAATGVEEQPDLFGGTLKTKSYLGEEAYLVSHIRDRLAEDKRIFGAVARDDRAQALTEAGNVLNQEENERRAKDATRLVGWFNALLQSPNSSVNGIIRTAAKEIGEGGNRNDVRERVYEEIKAAIEAEARGERRSTGADGVDTPVSTAGQAPSGNLFGDTDDTHEAVKPTGKTEPAKSDASAQNAPETSLKSPESDKQPQERGRAPEQANKPKAGDWVEWGHGSIGLLEKDIAVGDTVATVRQEYDEHYDALTQVPVDDIKLSSYRDPDFVKKPILPAKSAEEASSPPKVTLVENPAMNGIELHPQERIADEVIAPILTKNGGKFRWTKRRGSATGFILYAKDTPEARAQAEEFLRRVNSEPAPDTAKLSGDLHTDGQESVVSTAQPPQTAEPTPDTTVTNRPDNSIGRILPNGKIELDTVQLGRVFAEQLRDGAKMNRLSVNKLIAAKLGISPAELSAAKVQQNFDPRQADEAFEYGVILRAREIIKAGLPEQETFNQLLDLYQKQMTLSERDSRVTRDQQYSTPVPMAYLLDRYLGFNKNTTVYEPTAGNGMLVIGANPANVTVNELDNGPRLDALRDQGFQEVLNEDALDVVASHDMTGQFDAVVMNPPFHDMKPVQYEGFRITKLEHLIALRTLDAMKDDGRAGIIIGGHNFATHIGQPRENLTEADDVFFNYLYGHYNVVHNIDVDGKLYGKQGTTFPVRILTIEGRKASPVEGYLAPSRPSEVQSAKTWDELATLLQTPERTVQDGNIGRHTGVSGKSRPRMETPPQTGQGAPVSTQPSEPTRPTPTSENATERPIRSGSPTRGDRPTGEAIGTEGDRGSSADRSRSTVHSGQPGDGVRAEKRLKPEDLETNEYQIEYQPHSDNPVQMKYLTPKNMSDAADRALSALRSEVGEIDEFVCRELVYPTKEDMYRVLSGVQIDGIALALSNIKKGKGLIIGDGTGVGKGREGAAVLWWAVKNGHFPVYLTCDTKLFSDVHRDLMAIGRPLTPYIMNGDAEKASVVDKDGKIIHRARGNRADYEQIARDGRDAAPLKGKDFLIVNYHQLSGDNSPQQQALERLMDGNIAILDESHYASGASKRGEFIRDHLLSPAKGVLYLSATYAKRPETIPLYFRTNLGDSGMDMDALVSAVKAGGVPLQQIMASQLAESGQYIRRELDFGEVEGYEVFLDEEHAERDAARADQVTASIRAIVTFDKLKNVAIKKMHKEARAAGLKQAKLEGHATTSASVKSTSFTSIVHNIIGQLLLALKADVVVEKTVAEMARGRKPVIALSNTLETHITALIDSGELVVGEQYRFTFKEILRKALRGTLRYIEKDHQGNKVVKYFTIPGVKVPRGALAGTALPPEGVEAYRAVEALIDTLDSDLSGSPLDYIQNALRERGVKIGEMTGREYAFDKDGRLVHRAELEEADAKGRKKKPTKNEIVNRFNGGEIDAILLNASGATGLSIHASAEFSDTRPRSMIVAQSELNIDTEIQKYGRIHRTGQVAKPYYMLVQTALPAEIRPAIVLQKKMASLNANTSANAESHTTLKDIPDMLNKYGDRVVMEYLQENPEINDMLGDPLGHAMENDESTDSNGGPTDLMRKTSGLIAIMDAGTQKAFYENVEARYRQLIQYLDEMGENDLIAHDYDFGATTVSKSLLAQGEDESNSFKASTYIEKVSTKLTTKPYPAAKVETLIREAGDSDAILSTIERRGRNFISRIRTAYNAMPDSEENAENRARLQAIHTRVSDQMREFQATKGRLQMGHTYTLHLTENGEGDTPGILIGIHHSYDEKQSADNPLTPSRTTLTFAVPDTRQEITIPLSQIRKVGPKLADGVLPDWNTLIPNESRATRYIITGNLLQGLERSQGKGQVITFTTEDGERRVGILLPEWMKDQQIQKQFNSKLVPAADAFKHMSTAPGEWNPEFGRNVVVVPTSNNAVTVIYYPEQDEAVLQFGLNAKTAKGEPLQESAVLESATKLGKFRREGGYWIGRVEKAKLQSALDTLSREAALQYEIPRQGFSNRSAATRQNVAEQINAATPPAIDTRAYAVNPIMQEFVRDAIDGPQRRGLGPGAMHRSEFGYDQMALAEEETQERIEEAMQGRRTKTPLQQALGNVGDHLQTMIDMSTRTFRHLPRGGRFAIAHFELTRLPSYWADAATETVQYLKGITMGLDKDDMYLFSWKVLVDDLTHEAEDGHPLPFGFTPESLTESRQIVDAEVTLNEKVANAIDKRRQIWEGIKGNITSAYKSVGVDLEKVLTRQDYFRHEILEYAREEESRITGRTGKKLKVPTNRSHLKRREGSERDINMNYLEVEYEVMGRMLADTRTAEALSTIIHEYDILPQLKARAIRENDAATIEAFEEILSAGEFSGSQNELRAEAQKMYRQTLNRKQAMALQRIEKLAAMGELPYGPDGRYEQLVEALADIHQFTEENGADFEDQSELRAMAEAAGLRGYEGDFTKDLFSYMGYLVKLQDDSSATLTARMLFKGMAEKRATMKAMLGNEYVTWRDLVPDDYATWQPRDGFHFFKAPIQKEQTAEQLLAALVNGEADAHEVKTMWIRGQRRKEVVLPMPLVQTLDDFLSPGRDNAVLESLATAQRYWKQYVLLNPRRAIAYNLRNMSGDLEVVIRGNPRALKQLPRAVRELTDIFFAERAATGDLAAWQKMGGTHGLLSAAEFEDLSDLKAFAKLFRQYDGKTKVMPADLIRRYWKAMRRYSDFRESILRYANYLDYLDQLKAGEGIPSNYGASIIEEVDALPTIEQKAFKLSNELLGAYDQISEMGRILRKYAMPFWSWNEVNFGREMRLLRNVVLEEKQARRMGRRLGFHGRVALRIGYFALRLVIPMLALAMWNSAFFKKEEDDLPDEVKNRPHLIYGSGSGGQVYYLGRLGAFSDLLEWAGLDSTNQYVKAYYNGDMTLKEIADAMAHAPINKLVQASSPIFKLPAEYLTGRSLYPNYRDARPIIDKGEYVAQQFSVKEEFDVLTGRPHRNYWTGFATSQIGSANDAKETAYYGIRDRVDTYKKQIGKPTGGGSDEKNATQMALYQFKRAARFHDTRAQAQYMRSYFEQGGTHRGLAMSLRAAHPLYGLNDAERATFAEQKLRTPAQQRQFTKSILYYNMVIDAYSPYLDDDERGKFDTWLEKTNDGLPTP